MVTGEAEINAASSLMALSLSPLFNLTKTYFLIAGIAGINPSCGTTGSVAFSRYAVQVALQYELDRHDIPSNYTTGYIPFGQYDPETFPIDIYGTEVFELNANLQQRAISLAKKANLSDEADAKAYRAKYPHTLAGSQGPEVFAGDTATSDVWFSGPSLGEAFGQYTKILTNTTGSYCMTAQEDNGSLEALLRATMAGHVDFSRIMLMRTASDFDRPPPGVSSIQNLLYVDSSGFEISLDNIYNAGIEVVKDIQKNWEEVYEKGVKATNYVGDLFDSLHGSIPPNIGSSANYGNGSLTING